jgi:hypothetical protein
LKYARALRRSAFIIAPLGRAGLPVTVHELLASFVEAVECSPQFLLEPARPIAIPPRCWHYAEVPLDGLPDWGWYDICAHLKCTRCGSETSGVRLVTVGLS